MKNTDTATPQTFIPGPEEKFLVLIRPVCGATGRSCKLNVLARSPEAIGWILDSAARANPKIAVQLKMPTDRVPQDEQFLVEIVYSELKDAGAHGGRPGDAAVVGISRVYRSTQAIDVGGLLLVALKSFPDVARRVEP